MRRLGCIIVFLGAAFLRAAPLYAQGAVTGFVGGTPPDGRIMSGVLTSTGLTGTLQLDATSRLPVSTFPGAGGLQAVNLTQVLSAAHSATNPVHVRLTSGAASVDPSALAVVGGGAEATAIRFTLANDSTGLLSVDDNGGSLTVDNAALSVTGGGAELGALRVTVANDSTGVLSVDDNGGALTVDSEQLPAALVGGRLDVNIGASAVTLTVDSELTTADLDPGAGTDTRSVIGLALATAGGATLVGAGADGVPVPVSDDGGSLTVDGTFWQATQPVSGTFWQATQPVSSTQLPAALGAQLSVASISFAPATDASFPVTGTFWQATQPISAAALPLPAGASTEATLATRMSDATGLAISGQLPAVLVGGRLSVDVGASALPSGAATEATLAAVSAQLPAALVGGRLDINIGAASATVGVDSELTTADLDPGAGTDTRSTVGLAIATTGGATLVGAGADGVPVPVSDDGGSLTVDGTFWQATQPVSGTFWQATQPVSGTFWQATQPVSAATLPLPTGATTEATLSTMSGKLPAALVGGRLDINIGASAVTLGVDSELTTADFDPGAGTDTRSVVGLALATTGGATLVGAGADGVPVPVSDDGGSLTVDGTFWQATQPVSGTFWQATQPISAASLPLPTGAATEATLTTLLKPADTLTGVTTVATVTNLAQLGGQAVSMNSGVRDAGTQRVTIATNDSVPVTGTFWQATQPVSAAALPLPADAASETTLAALNAKVPASPATDRTTVGGPFSVRVSDGTSFYTPGIPLAPEAGMSAIAPQTSNGATAVALLAGTALQYVYPTTIICTNESTTDDEIVELLSSTIPTVLARFYLPAKGTMFFDGRGDIRTLVGEGLSFRAADATVLVKCSGAAIKR